ncbi:hypothetical protein [Dactylosporangium sp. NPDC050588]|uniref:hypothetical protein n=1 Tax=Dactylosporangium sp. NPDC050588 TaxID=3157211 RepID=UPI00340CD08B
MRRHPLLGAAVAGAALVLAQVVVAPAATAVTVPPAAPTVTAVSTSFTVGVKGKFRFAEPAGGPVPAAFVYQLNSGAPTRVATSTRAVTAVEPDGTFTDTTTIFFNAAYPPPFADQDLTGDGRPDLLTAGPATGLPQGVWLAAGRAQRGGLRTPAAGIAGLSYWPAPDFDGVQVISGRFTGTSFNDVFVFYPTGPNAGLAMIVPSLDDGGPLDVTGATMLYAGTMSDLDGNNPIAVANAYDSAASGFAYPDLFGIVGAPGSGYTLDYYPNFNGTGAYYMPNPTPLATPAGGTDWESWRIASKLLPSGTALLLWNGSTGAVHLWTSVTYDGTTLHYTDHRLATDWHPDAASVQLTQDADGNPVIWTVSTAGVATAYLVKNLSTLKAQPAQPLLP